MSVLNFIKESRVLVAGLFLPFLLIVIFTVVKNFSLTLTSPPLYKVIFYSSPWNAKGQLTMSVDDKGHLVFNFDRNENYKSTKNDQTPTVILYIYDPKTKIVYDTEFTLGKDDKLPSLDKFSNLKLSQEQTSPDGYIYEQYRYRHRSFITDIFAYRSSGEGPFLSKNGIFIKIPMSNTDYNAKKFLGWVIEGDVK